MVEVKQVNWFKICWSSSCTLHVIHHQGGFAYHIHLAAWLNNSPHNRWIVSWLPLQAWKLGMEQATARFRELVHIQGVQAYIDLIHMLKITSCKLISDLMDADEDKVLQSIQSTNGHHFKTGFTVHTRASSSRTYSPQFSTEQFNNETNKLICELHLEASETCAKMVNIHYYITILKTKVSPQNFLQNSVISGIVIDNNLHHERQERQTQSEQRKQKVKETAAQEKYFSCTQCLKGFRSQRDLDNHTMKEHIFICGECFKIFPAKAERDTHMGKEHKGQQKKPAEQEMLLVKEWQKRMSREEKDRRAKQNWDDTWAAYVDSKQQQETDDKRCRKKAKTKEKVDTAAGDNKDKNEHYHPSEDAGDRSSIDPTYEPSRKDLKYADKEGDQ